MNKKYIIYREKVEISTAGLKKYGNVFSAHMAENGLRNGSFDIIAELPTIESAREELKKYKTSVRLTSGYSGNKFYYGDLYYFEESEWNDYLEDWDAGDGDDAEEEIMD